MVYRGKPSGGCRTCRERKVKCDETKPACRRCSRARRVCRGYRDELSMWFKDQTEEFSRKLQPEASMTTGLCRLWTAKNSSFGDPISFSLGSEKIHQATCLFVNSASVFGTSCLSNLNPFPVTISEKAIMAAVAAVGLAQLSGIYKSPSIRFSAMEEYNNALNFTNLALCDPSQAQSDRTLMAIVCLSIYGIVLGREAKPLESWLQHWKGITALIQLRGPDQFRRPSGIQLFQILRNGVTTSCLQQKARIPRALVEMPGYTNGSIHTDADRLSQISFRLCELRADVHTAAVTELGEILIRAYELDLQLEHFVCSLPPSFIYTVSLCSNDTSFRVGHGGFIPHYDGKYHIYQSREACHLWNNYRLIRILVNELILSQLQSAAPQTTDTRQQSEQVIQLMGQLAADICYSAWYNISGNMDSGQQADHATPVGTHAGLTLLLPLLIAAAVMGISSPTGTWISELLNLIGQGNGIDTALVLREYFQQESIRDPSQMKKQSAFGWLNGSRLRQGW